MGVGMSSAPHLSRMVDDLVDLARINRGELALQRKPAELQDILFEAVEARRPQIERRHHLLSVELPALPILLEVDPLRLVQLLSNLLDNAAKYTPEEGSIWLTAEMTDGQVQITVRDTGVGIPEEQLGNIFDPFIQLNGSVERSTGGLGLGLTLVQRLAELHGGSVEVASEGVGRGSRFTVRLPTAPVVGPETPSQADAATSLRILVVDDKGDVAESLAVGLTLDGHTVRIIRDGPDALEALQAFAPEVVVRDVGLPGTGGDGVARHLRESTDPADLVLITLNGSGNGKDRLHRNGRGALRTSSSSHRKQRVEGPRRTTCVNPRA